MYYSVISSISELIGEEGVLRLPRYLPKAFVMDETREKIIKRAIDYLSRGTNVLICGRPGTGKTAIMFKIIMELSKNRTIGYIREGVTTIGNEHVDKGILLFYDDIPRMNENALKSIIKNRVKGIIATARTEELAILKRVIGIDLEEHFKILEVPPMSHQKLEEMLFEYLDAEAIKIEDDTPAEEVVKKAEGLPVYVWQVVRELKIRKKSLSLEYAKTIPQGMLDYVDDILWRLLGGKTERYEALLTLLIMTDFVKFSVHQDLYNYIYLIAKERRMKTRLSLEDIITDATIEDISRYLARDGGAYAFRLPHDSWADVLKGKSNGPMASEITKMNSLYTKKKRIDIVMEAANRAWHYTLKDAEDAFRKKTFRDNIVINFGKKFLDKVITKKPVRPSVGRREIRPKKAEVIIIPEKDKILISGGVASMLYGIMIFIVFLVMNLMPEADLYYDLGQLRLLMIYISILVLLIGLSFIRLGYVLDKKLSGVIAGLFFIMWFAYLINSVILGEIYGIIEDQIIRARTTIGFFCGLALANMFKDTGRRVGLIGAILIFIGMIPITPLFEIGMFLVGSEIVRLSR